MGSIREIGHLTLYAGGSVENYCLDHSGSGLSPALPGWGATSYSPILQHLVLTFA